MDCIHEAELLQTQVTSLYVYVCVCVCSYCGRIVFIGWERFVNQSGTLKCRGQRGAFDCQRPNINNRYRLLLINILYIPSHSFLSISGGGGGGGGRGGISNLVYAYCVRQRLYH